MEKYKMLCELIQKEQFGEEITNEERAAAVLAFLNGRNDLEEIYQFKKRMRVSPKKDCMYPNYYIPPYNCGKKLRLVQGYLPKTNILYANHYETEILRLLVKFEPDNEIIKNMVCHTLERFDKTCFGNYCDKGECLTAGICVLRFLAIVQPRDESWINKLLNPMGELFLSFGAGHAALKKEMPLSYFLMAITDINNDKTRNLIKQKKEWLVQLLRKGWLIGKLSNGKISEGDTYNLIFKYIIRNAVCTLPECKKKGNYRIYVDDIDKRCYCDIL